MLLASISRVPPGVTVDPGTAAPPLGGLIFTAPVVLTMKFAAE
jgi:hypothetical protein